MSWMQQYVRSKCWLCVWSSRCNGLSDWNESYSCLAETPALPWQPHCSLHCQVWNGQSNKELGCYVLRAPIFIFHLLTNTFPSRDLPPYSLHHMTTSPDRLPIHFTMWFSLAMHVTHTDSYLVARILGLTRESVRLGMTPYFVGWLFTSTGTSSIRLESWQLPRCI